MRFTRLTSAYYWIIERDDQRAFLKELSPCVNSTAVLSRLMTDAVVNLNGVNGVNALSMSFLRRHQNKANFSTGTWVLIPAKMQLLPYVLRVAS